MRVPARLSIQTFVGGALAIMGVESIMALPRHFALLGLMGLTLSCILSLKLPLGLGILFENSMALRLTKIYLWLFVVLGCLSLLSIGILKAREFQTEFAGAWFLPSLRTLLLSGTLLGLLLWSDRRERHLTNR